MLPLIIIITIISLLSLLFGTGSEGEDVHVAHDETLPEARLGHTWQGKGLLSVVSVVVYVFY